MAYASWSVVFGEQPSTAKWNILGANDASFANGTGIANLAVNTTTISNPYKFRAYRTAALNTPTSVATPIIFDTESFDTNNNFNVATGEYTAPVAGFYNFGWRAKTITSGTEQLESYLYVGAVSTAAGTNSTAPTQHITTQGSALIQLAASNVVTIRVANTAARAFEVGSATLYFSGFLVSQT